MAQENTANFEYLQNQLQIGNWEPMAGFDSSTLDKTIAIFGVGGSGSPMALTLTRMGFKRLILVDKDIVERKNLTRQVLYGEQDIGIEKTQAAKENLSAHHSFQSDIESFQIDIIEHLPTVEAIIQKSDFVFNLVDNHIALFHVSKACRKYQKPVIYFGTGVIAGLTSTVLYQAAKEGTCIPCLQGLSPDFEKLKKKYLNKPSRITPSWYPTPALGAAFSAVLLIKILLKKPIKHNCIITSLYALQLEKLNIKGKENCSICTV